MNAFWEGFCSVFSFGMWRRERPPARSVAQQFTDAFKALDEMVDRVLGEETS